MLAASEPVTPAGGDLELAAGRAMAACGGNAREAVKARIVTVDFLDAQVAELRAVVSRGYSRGRYGLGGDRNENE